MRIGHHPLDLVQHLDLLHAWVTHPRSVYWQMQDATREDVRSEYERIAADPHHTAWLGTVDDEPAFLAEHYDPALSEYGVSELASHHEMRPGDVGMHVLVAPTDTPRHGFTDAVFAAVLRHLFADPTVERVVVEPDVRNEAIRAKNVSAGFIEVREVPLSTKTAMLSTCTREDFLASPIGGAHALA